MIDSNKINEIVNRIAHQFNPEMIILFGSYAAGNPTNSSDLDLLVIKETDLPYHKRSFDIHKALIGLMVPIDILVYTQNEYEQERKEKSSFLSLAIKTSKVLYERR